MLTKNNCTKCDYCGKFIGYQEISYQDIKYQVLCDSDGGPVDVDERYENYHAFCLEEMFHKDHDRMNNINESLEENTVAHDAYFGRFQARIYDPYEEQRILTENIKLYTEDLHTAESRLKKIVQNIIKREKLHLKRVNEDIEYKRLTVSNRLE